MICSRHRTRCKCNYIIPMYTHHLAVIILIKMFARNNERYILFIIVYHIHRTDAERCERRLDAQCGGKVPRFVIVD